MNIYRSSFHTDLELQGSQTVQDELFVVDKFHTDLELQGSQTPYHVRGRPRWFHTDLELQGSQTLEMASLKVMSFILIWNYKALKRLRLRRRSR